MVVGWREGLDMDGGFGICECRWRLDFEGGFSWDWAGGG